jgi:Asp-tRNA(Asn)/Glu-tRNA(Gln) amidotransferase A subunit family amidase
MPTYGLVPNAGCVPLGWSLDRIGPLARSARDCGAFLAVIAGPDRRDPYAVDRAGDNFLAELDGSLAGMRIGVERANHLDGEGDPAMPSSSKPAMTLEALEREDVTGMVAPLHLRYWNAVGNPALVLPMGFTANELPLSLQLAAPAFAEASLVRAGDAYQRETDWHLRVPPLAAAG